MIKINEGITKGSLQSAYVEVPFPKAKTTLENAGYRIISMQECAQLRMQESKDAHISKNGTWTNEALIYVPKKGMFLTKDSPVMLNAKEATNCFRNGQEFFLTNEQVKKSLENSIQLLANYIPVNRLGESDIGVFAFGDLAKKYGEFLGEAFKEYGEFLKQAEPDILPIYNAWGAMKDKPYVRPIWLRNISHWSCIDADSRGLYCNSVVCGVRDIKS